MDLPGNMKVKITGVYSIVSSLCMLSFSPRAPVFAARSAVDSLSIEVPPSYAHHLTTKTMLHSISHTTTKVIYSKNITKSPRGK